MTTGITDEQFIDILENRPSVLEEKCLVTKIKRLNLIL